LVGSLEYIDIDFDTFVQESFLISFFSKGGFTLKDIKDLDIGEYEIVLNEAKRIQNVVNPKQSQEDEE